MKIFPAIDIKNKKCVRLVKGDFDKKKSEYKKEQWLMGVFAQLDKYNVVSASIFADTSIHIKDKNFAFNIAKYAEKSAYRYRDTNPNTKKDAKLKELDICVEKSSAALVRSVELGYNVGRGANTARNLGNRPANHATPSYIADQVVKLGKEIGGFKVDVLEEKDMKKLGMGSLLSVSRGSVEPAKLVTMQYNGGKKGDKPIVLVGKGVTFDTGGYSLKPARFMEDMTYDMAGSAAVVGLMKNLALRKAKVNAVGVVGLVENMVSGIAQRPGDIVKSFSGKTIEVLNTDAEGRLVLADALTYTEKKYKPKFIIDLATLTGAIIVCLGSEYAGLFSNDDKLSKQILAAGENTEEKLWRMPLHKNYDKLMNSKNADVQNINYVGGAGSTTAAQFLQRFILNKTPWAHLDIAGMAFSKYGGALNSGGATGFGVRLLNQLIEENYE